MFDIARLDTLGPSCKGVAMPLRNPTTNVKLTDSKGALVTITLLGPSSPKSEELNRAFAMRRADFAARGARPEASDFERERVELLSALTVDWSFTEMDGKPFPCSPENIETFWSDPRWKWVQLQAWEFCQGDGNYLPL